MIDSDVILINTNDLLENSMPGFCAILNPFVLSMPFNNKRIAFEITENQKKTVNKLISLFSNNQNLNFLKKNNNSDLCKLLSNANALISEIKLKNITNKLQLNANLTEINAVYVANILVSGNKDVCVIRIINTGNTKDNNDYYVPPFSQFWWTDLNAFFRLNCAKYDLVLIDPPWENASVSRSVCSYKTMKYINIERMLYPLIDLLKSKSLVCFWITNSKGSKATVERLFKYWNFTNLGHWTWLKVAIDYNALHHENMYLSPMVPFTSNHKKPTELLLLGSNLKDNYILNNLVIVSPPCIVNHSRKLNIHAYLEMLYRKIFNCESTSSLELFARSLYPKWTSVGDQVLKYQESSLWRRVG